jgi:hypothetical protein
MAVGQALADAEVGAGAWAGEATNGAAAPAGFTCTMR